MEIIIIILLIIILALLAYWVFFYNSKKNKDDEKESLSIVLQQLNDISRNLDDKLDRSHKDMFESVKNQTDQSIKIIQSVTEKLTKLDETNKQVMGFTEQLQNLQDVLKNPKQRGVLGEYYLETTLKNVLPPQGFKMQYPFKDGTIVDAVVFVANDKIIPIDSKFSLENYNKIVEEKSQAERERLEKLFKNDIKKRIDETSKYIKPEEGTMDFAFMFIPHEAIYYDLLVAEIGGMKINTQDLIEYAFKKRVLIVSPTSFLAFLQTVLQGLKSLQIEKSAQEIKKHVENLDRHLKSYEDYHQRLGKSLETTMNHYQKSTSELGKIDKDVVKITNKKDKSLQAPDDEEK